MDYIKDKIAKLLALADSPNEHEAKAAMLKARQLMAEHKLRPEEIGQSEKTAVRQGGVGVFCTKMTDPWASTLSGIIGPHYCCKAIRYTRKGKKTVQIGFVGLEDDYEICKRIYLYAYDCIQAKNRALRAARRHEDWSGKELRKMCNAYGWGFCTGLAAAFQKQQEEHQEWGLVMIVPQAVEDATAHMSKPSVYTKMKLDGWRNRYASAGYQDGLKFDPGHRLESKVS